MISFKQPSKEELSHDFLWRVNNVLPKRCTECGHEEFYKKRYRQIKGYEKYLYENGYRMVKVFLNVSLDEQ